MNNLNKNPRKSYIPKRRESDDKNAVAFFFFEKKKKYNNEVVYHKIPWKAVPGKPDARSLGINSKGTVQSVFAASSKYREKQGPLLGKIQVKVPHQSPYVMKFEHKSH